MKINTLIETIKNILKDKFPSLKGIYFFGSRARNNSVDGSDYDLAIIFDEEVNWKFKDEIVKCIYSFMIENDIILDLHIYSEKDFYTLNTPFKVKIKQEGIYFGV